MKKLILCVVFTLCVCVQSIEAKTSNFMENRDILHEPFSALLQAHVHNGKVDYSGFAADKERLRAYLETLATVTPEELSRDGQLAYWINAYNAWTIQLILTKWPDISSIKELGSLFSSPWKKKFVQVKQGVITLDTIEHDIIRPKFKDARIHFAVNCSAKSCPPLLSEAYTEQHVQKQLQLATERFLNNPQNYYFKNNTLYVTKIMDWFEEDFVPGKKEFLLQFAQGELRREILARGDALRIKHLKYDWSLNVLEKTK